MNLEEVLPHIISVAAKLQPQFSANPDHSPAE